LDEQRNKLALEQGLVMLAAAKERAIADGVSSPETRQRHGDLLESLRELGNDIRLLVIGRQGESSDGVWGAMEPKTNVSSESHRKGAFRSPAHPPGITL